MLWLPLKPDDRFGHDLAQAIRPTKTPAQIVPSPTTTRRSGTIQKTPPFHGRGNTYDTKGEAFSRLGVTA
jgi:hypothetical protein